MLRLLRKAFGPLLLTVVIAAVATILLARNAGWESMVVTTGSMDPTYPAGSLVAAAPPTGDEQVGDVIVFVHPDARDVRVTHRITGIEPGGFATKGDANEDADPWTVPSGDVLGVVRGGVPGVGLAMTRFRTGPWPWLLASGILAAEGVHQFRRRDDEDESEESSSKVSGAKAVAGLGLFALVSGVPGAAEPTVAAFRDHADFEFTATSGCWDDDDSSSDDDCAPEPAAHAVSAQSEEQTSSDEELAPTNNDVPDDGDGSPEPSDDASGGSDGPSEPENAPDETRGEDAATGTGEESPTPETSPEESTVPEDEGGDDTDANGSREAADADADADDDDANAEPSDGASEHA